MREPASGTFAIEPRGPFSLERAAGFGFGPTTGAAPRFDGFMRLAFVVDGYREHAGVVLRQEGDGAVLGELTGKADVGVVRSQVARVLSLDHDGDAWMGVGSRDPVIGRLQRELPGLRPVLFHSPYEGAAWSIISARRQARQAASVRRRLAEGNGASFELGGEALEAFPLPEALVALESFQGLDGVRLQRLQALARTAAAGSLDVERLLALGPVAATEEVLGLPGIGPFYAGLIVVRATGFADVLPANEPKVLDAAARFYGLEHRPEPSEFADLAEAWRPFRTWACVLLRVAAG